MGAVTLPGDHKPKFGFPVGPWHVWFAWHPVWTWDGRLTWLRTVKRRLIQKHDHMPTECPCDWWEYERQDGYVEAA